MFDLNNYMSETRAYVDAALDRHMPQASTWPAPLHNAMRYSVFAGGKRLRPILCIAACEAVGGSRDDSLLPAISIEILHTYTLIHDDLPAMDNDDLRRGKPTSHKKFGEAIAILAGDALLTLAFELLSSTPGTHTGKLVKELAGGAGSRGVVGGQIEDLAAESAPATAELVHTIHLHKTADLFRASTRMGAIAGNADAGQLEALTRYGVGLGLAFQIVDDILDETSNADALGKAAGKDRARGKATYVAVHGIEKARDQVRELVDQAVDSLNTLGKESRPLKAVAEYTVERSS